MNCTILLCYYPSFKLISWLSNLSKVVIARSFQVLIPGLIHEIFSRNCLRDCDSNRPSKRCWNCHGSCWPFYTHGNTARVNRRTWCRKRLWCPKTLLHDASTLVMPGRRAKQSWWASFWHCNFLTQVSFLLDLTFVRFQLQNWVPISRYDFERAQTVAHCFQISLSSVA